MPAASLFQEFPWSALAWIHQGRRTALLLPTSEPLRLRASRARRQSEAGISDLDHRPADISNIAVAPNDRRAQRHPRCQAKFAIEMRRNRTVLSQPINEKKGPGVGPGLSVTAGRSRPVKFHLSSCVLKYSRMTKAQANCIRSAAPRRCQSACGFPTSFFQSDGATGHSGAASCFAWRQSTARNQNHTDMPVNASVEAS